MFSRNKGVYRNSKTIHPHETAHNSFFDDCSNSSDINKHKSENEKDTTYLFNHIYINQIFPEKEIEDISIIPLHKREKRKKIITMYQRLKKKLKFDIRTMHLALMFYDKIFTIKGDTYSKVSFHIALGCLVLSMKFMYLQSQFPYLKYFETLCGNGYYFTIDEIKYYEVLCLKLLEYNLGTSTAIDFVTYYDMKKAFFINNTSIPNEININSFKQKVYSILLELLYLVPYTHFKPHELALYAITQAKESFHIKESIPSLTEQIYNIKQERLDHICEVFKHLLNYNNDIPPQTHRVCSLTMTISDKAICGFSNGKTNSNVRCTTRNNGKMLKTATFCDVNNGVNGTKYKKRKSGSLCEYINSKPSNQSFLDDYLQTNLKTYRRSTKEKTMPSKCKNSQSSDSNYKKDTDDSSDDTPDNVKLNIINSKKYKIKNIQNSIITNIYYPVVVRRTQHKKIKKTSSVDEKTLSIQAIFQSMKKTTNNITNTYNKRPSIRRSSINNTSRIITTQNNKYNLKESNKYSFIKHKKHL